jgi:Domain of unknown function (DUF4158)
LIICVLEWSAQDLVASWTLVGNKTGATRLGFAVLLKFFEIAARFPSVAGEVPPSAVAYLAEHLHVTADAFLVDRFYVALSDGAPRPSPRSPSKNRSASRRSGGRSGTIWTHPRHDQLPGDP